MGLRHSLVLQVDARVFRAAREKSYEINWMVLCASLERVFRRKRAAFDLKDVDLIGNSY